MVTLFQNTTLDSDNMLRLSTCSLSTPLLGVRMSSTIGPSTHLGIKIVLDHTSCFARLFIEDLTTFVCSIRRSIYLGDQLSTWVETPRIWTHDAKRPRILQGQDSGFCEARAALHQLASPKCLQPSRLTLSEI